MHLLLHILGIDDMSGRWYAWWSGSGSDVEELFLLGGAVFALYRRHQCETRRCLRLVRHQTAAGHHVCHRHSALGRAPSRDEILAAHHVQAGTKPPTA